MQKKSFTAYRKAFDQMKTIATNYNCEFASEYSLTDFEHAARKALKYSFLGIKLRSSFFHYKLVVARWINQHGF